MTEDEVKDTAQKVERQSVDVNLQYGVNSRELETQKQYMTPAPKSRKYEEEESLLDFDKINDRYQSSELTDRTKAVDLRGYFGNTYKTDPQLQGLGAYSAA